MGIYTKTNPYFYIIRNKETEIMYAGARWAKGCNPEEFMKETGYQTSSSIIHSIVKEFGLDIFEVLRIDTYCDGLHPYDYESIFLQTINCAASKNWYNIHNNNNNKCSSFGSQEHIKFMLENYGVENASQSEIIKEKKRNTNIQNYGVENVFQSEEIKQKIKKTNLEKYGIECYTKTEEYKEKSKQTCLEKYGYEYSSQHPKTREKFKKTCLEKYDFDHPQKSSKVREKTKATNLARYGFEHPMQNEEVKLNGIQTIQEKYGIKNITNVFQLEEIKQKSKNTMQEIYGVDHQSKRKKICDHCGEYKGVQHQHLCQKNPNRKLDNRKRGDEHPKPGSKIFILTSPTGEEFTIIGGINKFCKEHGFDWGMLRTKHSHKGWTYYEVPKSITVIP